MPHEKKHEGFLDILHCKQIQTIPPTTRYHQIQPTCLCNMFLFVLFLFSHLHFVTSSPKTQSTLTWKQTYDKVTRLSDTFGKQQGNPNVDKCPCNKDSQSDLINIDLCTYEKKPKTFEAENYHFLSNGQLGGLSSFTDITKMNYFLWASSTRDMCNAHRYNAAAIMAAPSFDLHIFETNPQTKKKWIMNTLNQLHIKHMDGIVFDYHSYQESITAKKRNENNETDEDEDKHAHLLWLQQFATLLKETREIFDNNEKHSKMEIVLVLDETPFEPLNIFFDQNIDMHVIVISLATRLNYFQMYAEASLFQHIEISVNQKYGTQLFLDGKVQSSSRDEIRYHESLVHPVMLMAMGHSSSEYKKYATGSETSKISETPETSKKTVFIAGGGEMATAREILKYKNVDSVTMVDIDSVLCDAKRTELNQWSKGVRNDTRFQLYIEDAFAYLENTKEMYDVIIIDIVDPGVSGPGAKTYTLEFYKTVRQRLKPNGYLVTQSGMIPKFNTPRQCFGMIHRTLRSVFKHVYPYGTNVPSFRYKWGFHIATNHVHDKQQATTITTKTTTFKEAVNKDVAFALTTMTIEERNAALDLHLISPPLIFYDGITHLGLFGLSVNDRQVLYRETNIIKTITDLCEHISGVENIFKYEGVQTLHVDDVGQVEIEILDNY